MTKAMKPSPAHPRRVRVSSGTAFANRSSLGSYTPSTRSHREPHGQYVLCGILVSVMAFAAFGTSPLTHAKPKTIQNMPTAATRLSAGEEAVDLRYFLSVDLGLIFEHADCHANTGIRNTLSETMVANHTAKIQILDKDVVESPDELGRHLIEIVFTAIHNMGVNPRHLQSLLIPSSTPLVFSGKYPLRSGELPFLLSKILRVGDPLSRGERRQPRDAEINPDRSPGFRQFLAFFVKAQSHEVAISTVLGYRNRAGLALELPAPANAESADLGNNQIAIDRIPLERRAGIFCALFAAPGLERRVACTLFKEVDVGSLQVSKRLLFGNGTDFGEPGEFRFPLQVRQQCRRLVIPNLLSGTIGIRTQPKRPVVDETRATKGLDQRCFLALGRVESELVADLHTTTILCVNSYVKRFIGIRKVQGSQGD